MKKLLVFGMLGVIAICGLLYAKLFLDKRYDDYYSLSSQLFDNCVVNLKRMARTPSSFEVSEARVFIGGPHLADDAKTFGEANEFLAQLVEDGAAFLPLNVHVSAEVSDLYGGTPAVDGTCRYAALEFSDGVIDAVRLMALSLDNSVISNPYFYDTSQQNWFDVNDDIETGLDIRKLFSHFHAVVTTVRLEGQSI